jgi:hypothetical protein
MMLKAYRQQLAFDRDLSAATSERPFAFGEGHTTKS